MEASLPFPPRPGPPPGPDPHVFHPGMSVTGALVGSTGLSLLACCFLIFTFVRWKHLRRHPSSIMLYRSVADALACAIMLCSHLYYLLSDGSDSSAPLVDCRGFSFAAQLAFSAAELYFACLSIDLVVSLRNPFTDYRWNMFFYHVGVGVVSITAATLLVTVTEDGRDLYGRDNWLNMCWVRNFDDDGHIDTAFWSFFVAPLACIYAVAAGVLMYATRRLRQGLPETFDARLDMYRSSVRFVSTYLLYWILVMTIFFVVHFIDVVSSSSSSSSRPAAAFELQRVRVRAHREGCLYTPFCRAFCCFSCRACPCLCPCPLQDAPPDFLSLMLAFALGGRGAITCLVWLMTFAQGLTCSCTRGLKLVTRPGTGGSGGGGSSGGGASSGRSVKGSDAGGGGRAGRAGSGGTELTAPVPGKGGQGATAGGASTPTQPAAEDTVDLRPPLNQALRKEILYYTTLGIAKSVHAAAAAAAARAAALAAAAAGDDASTISGGQPPVPPPPSHHHHHVRFPSGTWTSGAPAHASGPHADPTLRPLGRYGITYRRIFLSRRREEHGLFDLARERARVHRQRTLAMLAAQGSTVLDGADAAAGADGDVDGLLVRVRGGSLVDGERSGSLAQPLLAGGGSRARVGSTATTSVRLTYRNKEVSMAIRRPSWQRLGAAVDHEQLLQQPQYQQQLQQALSQVSPRLTAAAAAGGPASVPPLPTTAIAATAFSGTCGAAASARAITGRSSVSAGSATMPSPSHKPTGSGSRIPASPSWQHGGPGSPQRPHAHRGSINQHTDSFNTTVATAAAATTGEPQESADGGAAGGPADWIEDAYQQQHAAFEAEAQQERQDEADAAAADNARGGCWSMLCCCLRSRRRRRGAHRHRTGSGALPTQLDRAGAAGHASGYVAAGDGGWAAAHAVSGTDAEGSTVMFDEADQYADEDDEDGSGCCGQLFAAVGCVLSTLFLPFIDALCCCGACNVGAECTLGSPSAATSPEYLPRFEFRDFEPALFSRLRERAGITPASFIASLSSTRREKFGEGGNSGAFLYFSHDEVRERARACVRTQLGWPVLPVLFRRAFTAAGWCLVVVCRCSS